MGTQINFYMTENDEREFMEFLRRDHEVGVLQDRTATPEPAILAELPDLRSPWGFSVWLWHAGISSPPKLRFVAAQNHYCLDPMPNEVVEFSRSRMDEGRLVRGRLWTEFVGWDRRGPSVTFRKSDAFKKWFNRLSGWIKRRATVDSAGDYLLTDAAEFVEHGGTVCQAVLAGGTHV